MEDARQLVRQAFEQARSSGKPDWHRMTSAVLKNRLLSITGGSFDESDYSASTFMMFIESLDDLVDIDTSSYPPIVELLELESGGLGPHDVDSVSSRPRIRSDLWYASLDYSSGTQYVWDLADLRARPIRSGENSPIISIVTQPKLKEWRREFIDDYIDTNLITPEQEGQVGSWITEHLPTSHLPTHLIPHWNGFLRDKVQQQLLTWFHESGIEPPQDLVTTVRERTSRKQSDAEALRRLILRVVGRMTERELEQLNLPPRAVMRVMRTPRH